MARENYKKAEDDPRCCASAEETRLTKLHYQKPLPALEKDVIDLSKLYSKRICERSFTDQF
jgi:hypothetical protein